MNYQIFLSYSHKDADIYGQEYILELKRQIEASIGCDDVVFLDANALGIGDEWNAKIKSSLHSCQAFICLLSENYINSEYCTRERLWWAQKEMKNGRLHQATLPIYYVEINPAGISCKDKWQELLIIQNDAVPWFPIGAQITAQELVKKRLESAKILASISKIIGDDTRLRQNFTSIPPYNQKFVGRINELRDIRQICTNLGMSAESIPVIHGEAGCGKSEIAYAYAHGYASEYPGGRFLIPMENISNWQDAWLNLANQTCIQSFTQVTEILGLTKEDQEQPPEKYATVIAEKMWKYSKAHGQTLILLDNLDVMELLTESGLAKLFPNGGIPDTLDIIATSRNTPHVSAGSKAKGYLLKNLGEEASLELLRLHCEDSPFNLAAPQNDDKETVAARELLKYLEYHAWSVEIIAGFLGQNYRYGENSGTVLAKLKKDFSITTEIKSFREIPDCTEKLLKPTIDKIEKVELGKEILDLACAAAMFAPEMISEKILEEFWKKQYGEQNCSKPDSWKWAWENLKDYHIVHSGNNGIARMHRNTQGYFRKVDIEKFEKFTDVIEEILNNINLTAIESRSVAGLAQFILGQKWGKKYFFDVGKWLEQFLLKWYYLSEAESLLDTLQKIAETEDFDKKWKTAISHCLAENYGKYYFCSCQYEKALESYQKCAAIVISQFSENHLMTARAYTCIMQIYLAVGNYQQALIYALKGLKIREQNSSKEPDLMGSTYSNVAGSYYAMGDYINALHFFDKAAANAELAKNYELLATVYNNMGLAYSFMDDYHQALIFLNKSLDIRMAAQKNDMSLAGVCNNLGRVCSLTGDYSGAMKHLNKSLEIMESYLPENHPDLAYVYTNIGNTYLFMKENQKALEYHSKSLAVRKSSLPDHHLETARSYGNIGKTYSALKNYSEAETYFQKGFEILQSQENQGVKAAAILLSDIRKDYKTYRKNIPLGYRILSFFRK